MSDKALMLELPEVRHLVDLVPIARYAIKPSAVQLRFFAHARDTRMPIKRQCALLGVPWHARRIPAALASKAVLKLARQLEPTLFVQTMPTTDAAFGHWLRALSVALVRGLPDAKLAWLAFHAVEIPEEYRHGIVTWLCDPAVPTPAHRTAMKTILRRMEQRQHQARQNQPLETLLADQYRQWVLRTDRHLANLNMLARRDTPSPSPSPPANPVIDYPPGWLEPFTYGSFSVQLLRTYDEFVAEGRLMRNCVAQYFAPAQRGECRIASVRRDGRPVADVEFVADWVRAQMRGPYNTRVTDPAIVDAVNAFQQRFVPGWYPGNPSNPVAPPIAPPAAPPLFGENLFRAIFPHVRPT
jgi:hypothetical protein